MTPFSLPELPYNMDALEPHMSSRTLQFHYGMHHKGYLDKLNALLQAKENEEYSEITNLGGIILRAHSKRHVAIFNNAAQVLNHTFFWSSLSPKSDGNSIDPVILEKIEKDFGTFDKFKDQFIQAGLNQFGSGWVWLVWSDETKSLQIITTSNAETPIVAPHIRPLLTADVWEHGYYLDYQNRRADYLKMFIEFLANWDFARANLGVSV